MDRRQLLFKIVTITLALLTTLLLIYLIHHQGGRNTALDPDTLDYDQHDYIKSSDCSPEYDGLSERWRLFFPADTKGVACICPYSYEGRRCETYVNTVP